MLVFFSNNFTDSSYHVAPTNVNYSQNVPPQAPAHQTSDRQTVCQIGVSVPFIYKFIHAIRVYWRKQIYTVSQ